MKIELREITVRKLVDGYRDNDEEGVVGYSGKLDIRPPYQREFVYKDKQRDAVIDTITRDFPLNVMYWAVRDNDTYEIIDGQQRTVSIARYVNGDFSFNQLYFHNLPDDKQNQILNYKIMVYFCEGTDSERLQWFKTINIAGEKLTDQELRNAVYAGSWVSDAKRYFSKSNCPAHGMGGDYLSGSSIRQEYLQTVIKWISEDKIEDYMGQHHHNPNAKELWEYFQKVIDWLESVFIKKRREMKSVEWGYLYNEYKDINVDPEKVEKEVVKLLCDDDVTKNSGIYPYILSREEKHLNIRAFTLAMKRTAYEKQAGICVTCKEHFEFSDMQGDHITPWIEGGKTTPENCQMLCKECNRRKSSN